jgi:hypothetical protein
LNIDHTLSESALVGHELKTRAWISNLTYNQFVGSQDAYFVDSENIDCAEGRQCHINNDTLVKGTGSSQQNQIGWMTDVEGGLPPIAGHTWIIDQNNNIMIDDDPTTTHWFTYIGPNMVSSSSYQTSPPAVWNNNVFVGGPGGSTYPFLSERLSMLPAYPDSLQVTEVNTQMFANRTAAGISAHVPNPPGLVGTVGNVAVPASPTLACTFSPPNPSIPSTATIGTVITTATCGWSNGAPYGGPPISFQVGDSDGGRVAWSGNNLVVNASLASVAGTTRQAKWQVTQ